MVSASVVDNRNVSNCFLESSDSGLLQPLKLCVPSPSPKLCVTPPTPNVVSPTSPPLTSQLTDEPKEGLLQTVMGKHFPGVSKLKPKKKKSSSPVLVLPRYLAADSSVTHPQKREKEVSTQARPEFGRHFSQPVVEFRNVALSYCKRIGRSTQSLTLPQESAYRNLLQQEDMRAEAQHGGRFARGLRALRLFPQNKLSKRLIALKCKLQAETSMDEEEVEPSDSFLNGKETLFDESDDKKPKVKFERRHSRSSSDSIADAIIKSFMENNSSLDCVVEVKESPGSSPTSPSRKESYAGIEFSKHGAALTNFDSSTSGITRSSSYIPSPDVHITVSESFLRLPSNDDGPELRYVDGHLISNTSSNVSSTSDSSSSEEDASEDYSFDAAFKDKTPSERPTPSPVTVTSGFSFSTNESLALDVDRTDIPPINNEQTLKQAVFEEPLAISTPSIDSEKTSDVFYFDNSKPNVAGQQTDKSTTNSLLKSVISATITNQISDVQPVSKLKDNDLMDVPSSLAKTVTDTKVSSIKDSNLSSTVNVLEDNINNVRVSGRNLPSLILQTDPNLHLTSLENEVLQKSGNDCHPSITPIKECSSKQTEKITSVFDASIAGPSYLPSMTNIKDESKDILPLKTVPDVLHNKESVDNFSSVEGESRNNLSTGDEVSVASLNIPCIKTVSACKVDVVDVGVSCKTNSSVIDMQKWPVGKVNVVGLLNIPTSPLHKSQSASTLCTCPNATVEHDTNGEKASPCCHGDLQFHNIKHGPCFVLPSRQQQMQFSGGEEDKASASSPPCGQPGPVSALGSKISPSPAKLSTLPGIHRRSSDSDLSITPKGNSLTGSDRSSTVGGHFRPGGTVVRPAMNQESLDMMEYPFLTMSKYPTGFILHLGGTVSSRSVKLLERITNLEEPETRDAWWTEIRMEVRSHARALGCNVVLGYSEHTSICDDVCVLSASGTAAVINLQFSTTEPDTSAQHMITRHVHNKELMTTSLDRTDFERDKSTPQKTEVGPPLMPGAKVRHSSESYDVEQLSTCSVCHIPYNESSVPFRVNMLKCAVCRRGKVPDVLLTTIELPDGVPTTGKGCFLQAYVCRPKRDCRGELNAKEISDGLPFLEYELHRLLINKLKVKGMNSIFGLKVQVSIGEKMLVGLASGTAVFLSPLPIPPVPKVSAGNSWADEKKLTEIQKLLQDTVKKNRDFYQLKSIIEPESQSNGKVAASDTEDSEDELPELDLALGNKDTCVLEVDDAEDVDVISLLIDPRPPEGFYVVNTETIPGLDDQEIVKNIQMFTQVWRAKIPVGQPTSAFSKHFHRLLQSVYFKLRRMIPCALCDLQFGVELPEPDEMQISVLGMALGLGEPERPSNKFKRKVMIPSSSKDTIKKLDDSELIFNLEEDHVVSIENVPVQMNRPRPRSPVRAKPPPVKPQHTPPRERYGVDMTPLSYVPGGKIERYLGNLNFFFIRESTCIREGGGLSGFVHSFVTEVLAIVRAHVTALGGNAMVAYFMSECVLYHNPHKNQGQCLINVGGDVVFVSYYPEE